MDEKIREKKGVTGNQTRARKKAGIHEEAHKERYRHKPKSMEDEVLESGKQEVLEENDYSGTRTVSKKYRVTEKGSRKKK